MLAGERALTGLGTAALLNHKPHSGRGTHSLSFCNASRKEKITPESHILIPKKVSFQDEEKKGKIEKRMRRISKKIGN